ncbi:CubicO group peptidase, beta-lactamase class C family [Paenibacillus sp. 1_12]|uniref:serine hydrolase domain-containing protein n=1 Tax=Paenibacillus sp. 1_12 TaxID=1566278 RepID=UPI0008F1652F|nr:serine hydrolase domain-containing protein [Paenibacillus sp. 1_12]SFL67764.1 CubicO group peptidase, beta-lactamase class C family [Paenibacillus sp. 1_12]
MSKLKHFLQQSRDRGSFSGAAYSVGNSAGIVERGTVGTLSWDGPSVESDSLWDLASVTKPIAILPLMVMLEQGKCYLDDVITHFLPEYKDTDKANITLRQLLSHSSGIPGQQPLYQTSPTKQDLMAAVRSLPLRYSPGTDVEYTSQGYMILGDIIESIAGASLDIVLQQMVLDPIGLCQTMFNPPKSLHHRIAATEYCEWRHAVVKGEVHDENAVVLGGIAGHAGLFSTVDDMSLLCQTMLRLGETAQGRFLQPETVRMMTCNETPSLKLSRGLGWQGRDRHDSPAGDLFSLSSYGHTGFTGTSIWMDPEADVFVVLLTNRVHPTRANQTIKRIRSIFHNLAVLSMGNSESKQGEAYADS